MSTAGRRELAAGVAACVLLSLALLIVSGRPWLRFPPRDYAEPLSGRHVTGVPAAMAWVGIAGGLVLLATRGWFRRCIGALAGLAGIVAAVACQQHTGGAGSTAWPWVAFALSIGLVLAGGWVAARGDRWPALGGRYDAPGGPERRRVDPGVATWEALDRGEDPTA